MNTHWEITQERILKSINLNIYLLAQICPEGMHSRNLCHGNESTDYAEGIPMGQIRTSGVASFLPKNCNHE
ncbi:hypothetical protein SAMN05444280_12659 [Tangfeifania diversioriginum]|uniref:Uncharacterized protein n=1 Tax=Tangfeifania diversioriginum TaxID=1168035 RepID=A0A1M6LDC7_9BACT|nr:hypothetical protein SAMN05444280_12659 [Tangfeifania diversioriginum]